MSVAVVQCCKLYVQSDKEYRNLVLNPETDLFQSHSFIQSIKVSAVVRAIYKGNLLHDKEKNWQNNFCGFLLCEITPPLHVLGVE